MTAGTRNFLDWSKSDSIVLHSHYLRASILRAKAERYIFKTFNIQYRELSGLVLLWNYLQASQRQSGTLLKVVGWSGRNMKWKREATYTVLRACEMGLIDRVKSKQGHALFISAKGFAVLSGLTERMWLIDNNLQIYIPGRKQAVSRPPK